MKNHPKPTKEQMESAKEVFCYELVTCGNGYHPEECRISSQDPMGEVEDVASLLARREAQAEERGAEKARRSCGCEKCLLK